MRHFDAPALSVCLAALLSGCGNAPTDDGNILHNGIRLPDAWPPRYDVPAERREMPVPYLDKKPGVIPVNVGRQLFVDDFLIGETDMVRVFHKPDFYAANPVLGPTEEWEKTTEGAPYAAPFSDGVWFDEAEGKFKMWYLAGAGTLHKGDRQTFYTGYAESPDGKTWSKPAVGILPGTSIVDTCNRDAATVWLDKQEADPARRFKMFNVERRPSDRRWQFILKYSPDGIRWGGGVAQSGDLYDRSSVFYNPFRRVWCLSMRHSTPLSSRSRSYLEAAAPETAVSMAHRVRAGVPDKNVVFWFTPDDKEPRHPQFPDVEPGIYNFDAIAYESLFVGQYSVWEGPENNICADLGLQKRNEICLGFSRDGFHFSRPCHEPFLANNPVEGAWNWGNMQSVGGVPIIVGDSLYFYCSGRRLNPIMWDSYTSTGLAMLRRDGFASMRAEGDGTLTTEPVTFDGSHLFVNASARRVAVEVLDRDGRPVDGFAVADCEALADVNSTRVEVRWRGGVSIGKLAGREVRLRFHVADGDLYSFWLSPWSSGESRGYTAGGGPGLSPAGVDVPVGAHGGL